MEIKEALLNQCKNTVNYKLYKLQQSIKNIQESLSSETKSSVGDKHETGRAMLQLEREKIGAQLAEVQKLENSISKIDTKAISNTVRLGSIIYTSHSNYYIAISVGEISYNDEKFYAISPSTPIGKLVLGKKAGDLVVFRDIKFKIKSVL